MILSGSTIRRLGIISPHEPRTRHNGLSYGESLAGYDIRLAEVVTLIQGHTTLGVSLEHFTMPTNVLGTVKDKSTWARKGIQVQNTVIEPGWRGHLTLELSFAPLVREHYTSPLHVSSIDLRSGTPIAQVIFEYVDCDTAGYDGKYQDAACVAQPAIFEDVR